jgi:acyl transferase domain-containing protein/acyl carrier protein
MNITDARGDFQPPAIAIIGLSGRFPGAKNIEEFWQTLRAGVESITVFSDPERPSSDARPTASGKSAPVHAGAILPDVEWFDASFFGYYPTDAKIMDPQHRLFLECAWEALENAGYDSENYQGRTGVYAGVSLSTYLLNLILANREVVESVGPFPVMMGNDKDFLATRTSYKLGLKGPSITVQTACSTSLVAVHLACQSLLNGECDMALAGGVSVRVPQAAGFLYQEMGISSPDGHCRAFDAKAQGTIGGSGVGIVVLKRLEDALADGDSIQAVIIGSAVNNDGPAKVGYAAPSVEGQAAVIAEAQAVAGIEADTITYIEAHGTGTPLGDPVELAALTQAFRISTDKQGFCAIGSVKTNIGHLDAAAGVAGLIKTVLALRHKMLPPSLHFEQPNPKIDFDNSPFYVNTKLSEWKAGPTPRRAGVSAFGIGGTNAHVILEDAPVAEPAGESRPWQLLVLSAKTPSALETATANFVDYLKQHPDQNLADVAYTLQVGRRTFHHRRALVCRDLEDAATALAAADAKRVLTAYGEPGARPHLFMFPGQGAQYVNMGRELYHIEPLFRKQVDYGSELLEPLLGLDLRQVIYPSQDRVEEATQQLNQTLITQPALFLIEYALARLWMGWGVQPQGMIGHSIGEYVAACLAGVFSLEDALALVAARGRLMQQLPSGAMLAVPFPAEEIHSFLDHQLSLAAINGPSLCVVSGSTEAIIALQTQLAQQGVNGRRLHTSHAFHSEMMEPIVEPFAEQVERVTLRPPDIPFISNVTGAWITAQQATDPSYWARHLRQPVRFAEGLRALLSEPEGILLEVGPGHTLSTLARRHPDGAPGRVVLSSLRHPHEPRSDEAFLLNALGQLWLAGTQVDWSGFHAHQRRHRLPLPTYPFQRQRYWIDSIAPASGISPGSDAGAGAACEAARLPAPEHPRPELPEAYVAPRNAIEEGLAIIWQELFGIERVGIHDNFFDLGGHSLLITQLISRVRETFEVELPLPRLFEATTIAELAVVIEKMLLEQVEALTDDEAERLLEEES